MEVVMIKLVSKGIFYEDKTEEAIKMFEELAKESRKENGCIAYNLCRDINDSSILTMIEDWESIEALDQHRKTEHFTRIVPMIVKLKKSGELNVYEIVY